MRRIAVVAACIREGDTVLVAKRPAHARLPGVFELPGGKVEKDETPQQALVREIAEELSVPITVGQSLGTYETPYKDKLFLVTIYEAALTGSKDRIKPTEHDEIRWIRREDVETLETLPHVKTVLSRIL